MELYKYVNLWIAYIHEVGDYIPNMDYTIITMVLTDHCSNFWPDHFVSLTTYRDLIILHHLCLIDDLARHLFLKNLKIKYMMEVASGEKNDLTGSTGFS
jgi:hypothetical protein